MNNSQNLSNISKDEPVQLPLPGFKMEVKSPVEGWRKIHEMTIDGRLRIHMILIAPKRP